MQRAIISLLLLALVGCGQQQQTASNEPPKPQPDQAAISAAMQGQVEAIKASKEKAFPSGEQINWQKFYKAINDIDYVKCPTDFQKAWQEYLYQVQKTRDMAPLFRKSDGVDKAMRNLQDVALNHKMIIKVE